MYLLRARLINSLSVSLAFFLYLHICILTDLLIYLLLLVCYIVGWQSGDRAAEEADGARYLREPASWTSSGARRTGKPHRSSSVVQCPRATTRQYRFVYLAAVF